MDALRIILVLIGAGIIYAIYLYSRTSPGSEKNNPKIAILSEIVARLQQTLSKLKLPTFSRSQENTPHLSRVHYDELDEASLNTLAGLVANKDMDNDTSAKYGLDSELDPVFDPVFDPDSLQAINIIDETEISQQQGEDYLLVLNIKPKSGASFTGAQILHATKAAGMQFGIHDIFHRHTIVHDRVQKIPVCSMANMFEPGTFNFSDVSSVEVPGLVMFMQLPGPVDAETAFDNTLRTAQKISLELDARLCDDSHSILTTQTIEHLKEKMKAYHFRQRMQAARQYT